MRLQSITMKFVFLQGAVCLFSLATLVHSESVRTKRSSLEPVHCQWGPYGSWSACDGCSKTQTQSRSITVYPQFGGQPCTGSLFHTQPCQSTRACPLEEGCGERFRCQSGKCISQSLVCNGDLDCEEDSLDEHQCDSKNICELQKPPPNIEHTGQGFDAASRVARGTVINTKSFGGLCRKTFSRDWYRLPQSVLRYTFEVKATKDFSEEQYDSYWHYVYHEEQHEKTTGTDYGHLDRTLHEELHQNQSKHLIIMKTDVEVAQFQNRPPEHLPLSEEFWKALRSLPVVYNYAAYRNVLERFGTHYMSEGTLGGQFTFYLALNKDTFNYLKTEKKVHVHCVKTTHVVLFFIWVTTEHCKEYPYDNKEPKYKEIKNAVIKPDVIGGYPGHSAKLLMLSHNSPEDNGNTFSQWAGSVKDFPKVIKRKLKPLHELVKEVPCAGVKKHYLKHAIETYLTEAHPCHCRACLNNGLRVIKDNVCMCVCKPGTEGKACEVGTPLDEQSGVIHGDWACWSSWSTCKEGRKSRSRTCSRPAPRGGRDCSGKAAETTACEDEEELEYLRTMEPHCFDDSLTPKKSCKTPQSPGNGFVLYPKDQYPVGSKIEFTCIEGYRLIGDPIAECQEDLTWLRYPAECKKVLCDPPQLPPGISAKPLKLNYNIGEAISLSCPEGKVREGPAEIQCNAGLSWSPQPKDTKCREQKLKPTPVPLQCQPWENLAKNKCVCKVPHECKPSLTVCATKVENSQTRALSLCKVQALRCLGQQYTLVEDSACQWPDRTSTACPHCTPWENCNEETNNCRCKTKEECSPLGAWIRVCVELSGESAPVTMTECEAGVRKCMGETVRIISAGPCQS